MGPTTAGIRYPHATAPEAGEAIEVAKGVLWMRLPLPMALDHVNVYALDEGDSWTVIDTGFDSRKSRAIWADLLAGPMAGKPVSRVVITHHHPDHVGLAGWFVEQGATLHMPRTAWLMARMLTLDAHDVPTPETLAFYRHCGMDAQVYDSRKDTRPFNFADCVAPLPVGFNRLKDGETIIMGGRVWDIRMGNGHAPEHATFWSRDDNLVIGGDQLLPSISANLGVYATEPDADPVAAWLTSCAAFIPLARDDHFVLGGHKLPFTGLPLRLHQMIENHHGALARLEAFLEQPRRGGDCLMPVFKREITGDAYGLALVEAIAHLNHLQQAGRVNRWLDADGAYLWQTVARSKEN